MASVRKSWLLQEFSAHSSSLSAIALGKKSGRVMATGGEDGHVNLWAVGNPVTIMKFTGHSSSVESLSFNWLEELVCAGSRSGQLRIWNLGEGKVVRNLNGHKAAVTCHDFHSLGEFVASGSLDHKVKMWDYRRKGCIFTYTGHEGAVNALQFSPDGRWMASASDDNSCKIWDLTAGKLLHQFRDHSAAVTCLQFHPNELLIATGSKDKTVKVYDVEQFHLVSSSRPQACGILKVMFSENGHCVYSISQDMCHVYLWEPQPLATDSFVVKWGRPADVATASKQLLSATFLNNIVSNYIVDLNLVQSSVEEVPSNPKAFPRPTMFNQHQRGSNGNEQPAACCGATASKNVPTSKAANEQDDAKRLNRECDEKSSENYSFPSDLPSVFQPKTTLMRSPSGCRPINLPEKVDECHVVAPKESSLLHQGTNILPHLVDEPPSLNQANLEAPVKDCPSEAHLVQEKRSLDRHGNIVPDKDIPTRDPNIPEKLNREHNQEDCAGQNVLTSNLNDTRMTTIIPSTREDVFGLDMNAFLPSKKECAVVNNGEMMDSQALAKIEKGFESMRIVLTARYKNLEIVRALWGSDIMTSMNAAMRMKDQALLVDLLSVLNLKGSLWTLDLCEIMLPEICDLLTSRFETYVTTACAALKVVLQTFGPVIKSNVSAPPTAAVDLSREERYKKCCACSKSLHQIRATLEKHPQLSIKVGSRFRELNILIGTLD